MRRRGYLVPISATDSGRSFWYAFTRGLGYGLARWIFRGLK